MKRKRQRFGAAGLVLCLLFSLCACTGLLRPAQPYLPSSAAATPAPTAAPTPSPTPLPLPPLSLQTQQGAGCYEFTDLFDGCEILSTGFINETALLVCAAGPQETRYYVADVLTGSVRQLPIVCTGEQWYEIGVDGTVLLCVDDRVVLLPDAANSDTMRTFSVSQLGESFSCRDGRVWFLQDSTLYSTDGLTPPREEFVISWLPDAIWSMLQMQADGYFSVYGYASGDGDQSVFGSFLGNLTTGTREFLRSSEQYYCRGFAGGTALVSYYSRSDLVRMLDGGNGFAKLCDYRLCDSRESLIWQNGNYGVSQQTGEEFILRAYDFSRRQCTAQVTVPSQPGKTPSVWNASVSPDGRFLAAAIVFLQEQEYTGQAARLFVYDCLQAPSLTPSETPAPDLTAMTANERRAWQMGQQYGLTVQVGAAADREYNTYSQDGLYDEALQSQALEVLDGVLSKYPEGFFKEMLSGKIKTLEINLVGSIYLKDTGESANVRGYHTVQDTEIRSVIVMDASYLWNLEAAFAHELMHAADVYIAYTLFDRENEGYADWFSFLPPDFSYNNAYSGQDGQVYSDFAYVWGAGQGDAYFTDVYAKTFPVEDRARLFESMFLFADDTTQEQSFSGALESPFVRARAGYLCEVYREVFATVRSADTVWWESWAAQDTAADAA